MMPEGPEVRSLVDFLDHSFCSSSENAPYYLTGASIESGRYLEKEPEGWALLQESAAAKTLLRNVSCKGKFIYFDFGHFYVWSTLGMTGGWTTRPGMRNTRFSFTLESSSTSSTTTTTTTTLYYYDQRNFGTLKVSASREELDKKLGDMLGIDWLAGEVTLAEWTRLGRLAGKRKRPLCVFMMDQSKTAGIGNYVLSESLYRSGINPFASTSSIDEEGWRDLHKAVTDVLNESYEAQRPVIVMDADTMRQRVQRRHKRYGGDAFTFRIYSKKATVPDGNPVTKAVGTHKRSVYYDPLVQTRFAPPSFVDEDGEFSIPPGG
jgi:formamidopyrimidine-DNA glycosylase